MAQKEPADAGGSARTVISDPLRVQLAIEPHPEANCALAGAMDTGDVTQELRVAKDPDEGTPCCSSYECHLETSASGGSEGRRQYRTSSVEGPCICPVFASGDCISRLKGVRNGEIIAVLTVPDRTALREIMQELDAAGATVDVEWLVCQDKPEATTEIDVSNITDKQREAVETALEMGYYETPRQADLSAVADRLGISESATSQRLNAAETKLVRAFLDNE
ncbi:MAG: helix-turn-helix domain-containing protein [Halovenus sp.]